MKVIGIVAALPEEARILTRQKGSLIHLSDQAWLAQADGMGAEAAVAAGERLLAAGACALLSWGTAGALDPELASGTLLLPEKVLDCRNQSYRIDLDWRQRLICNLPEGLPLHRGWLQEAPGPVATVEAKRQLYEQSHAMAVDMESAALGRFAQQNNMPFMAVRAVTDTANTIIPQTITRSIDARGRLHLSRVLFHVCRRPSDWPALLGLANDFRAARTTLKSLAGPMMRGLYAECESPIQISQQTNLSITSSYGRSSAR